jgi:hypothetical protein
MDSAYNCILQLRLVEEICENENIVCERCGLCFGGIVQLITRQSVCPQNSWLIRQADSRDVAPQRPH